MSIINIIIKAYIESLSIDYSLDDSQKDKLETFANRIDHNMSVKQLETILMVVTEEFLIEDSVEELVEFEPSTYEANIEHVSQADGSIRIGIKVGDKRFAITQKG